MMNIPAKGPRPEQIDCLVYLPDQQDLPLLARTGFSLYGQFHRPLRMIVVANAAADVTARQVNSALASLTALPEPFELHVCLDDSIEPEHRQDNAFNAGIMQAKGPYIVLMNAGELLYPEACSRLLERLEATGAAMAFSAVRNMNAIWPGASSPCTVVPDFDMLARGEVRLNSGCLINRTRVSHGILRLDTSLPASVRGSDLALRVGAAAGIDFGASHLCLADRYPPDGSDAVDPAASQTSSFDQAAWTLARLQADALLLDRRMQRLDPQYSP